MTRARANGLVRTAHRCVPHPRFVTLVTAQAALGQYKGTGKSESLYQKSYTY